MNDTSRAPGAPLCACGTALPVGLPGRPRRHCSEPCKQAAQKVASAVRYRLRCEQQPAPPGEPRVCACGEPVPLNRQGPPRKHCSDACRFQAARGVKSARAQENAAAVTPGTCPCGALVDRRGVGGHLRRFCSDPCRAAAKALVLSGMKQRTRTKRAQQRVVRRAEQEAFREANKDQLVAEAQARVAARNHRKRERARQYREEHYAELLEGKRRHREKSVKPAVRQAVADILAKFADLAPEARASYGMRLLQEAGKDWIVAKALHHPRVDDLLADTTGI